MSLLNKKDGLAEDSFSADNSIFNSINFEDLELPSASSATGTIRKNGIHKFPSLSLLKNDADSDQNETASTSNKRMSVETADSSTNKRSKIDESQASTTLHDTLDFINLTALERNITSNDTVEEFDAFKSFLEKGDPITSSRKETASPGTFSQFFNQSKMKKNKSWFAKSQTEEKSSPEFKIPQPVASKDRLELFSNEQITSQYRKGVEDLFGKIEQSICFMGTSQEAEADLVNDNVLDIIFQPDNADANSTMNQSIKDINWTDDTLLNAVGIDVSFGSAFKQALMGNANKSINVDNTANDTLNMSLCTQKPVFYPQGPFYGLPLKVKELIQRFKGINKLYDWQDECLKLPAIRDRKNLIYALPTSGGKTLVAEILIFRELMCYKKNALLILPYVAIVQEKVWALSPFSVGLDFLVEEYASSKGKCPPRKRRRKNSVFIATIEKALNLVNSLIETGRLHELGLVVVDELHLVGEEGRGCILESLLTKLMYLKANVHIVGMSATIGNVNEVCSFLDATVYSKNFRPVELTEYVKCSNEIARINWNHEDESDLLVEHKKVDFNYSESVLKLDPDMLGGLVMEIVPEGSCLIFCATKRSCENVAYLLCRIINPELKNYRKIEKDQIRSLLKEAGNEICNVLNISIQFGIAYHHSGLTSDERRLIEDAFRAGVLSVICCTSTLAAGVNLPAKRVILRSPYVGRDFISLSRYKQMVGRAGRAGLGETGESILIANSCDLPKVRSLLLAPMNQATSSMHVFEAKGLRHLLLSCIGLGIANTRKELQAVANKTLMAVQCDKLEVNVKKTTDLVIKNLYKLGALREFSDKTNNSLGDITVKMDTSAFSEIFDGESPNTKKQTIVLKNSTKLVVSNLGTAAIKGGMELSRAHLLYADLLKAQSSLVLLDCLHLLYLVTPYDTSEQIRPNMQTYYHIMNNLGKNELQTARILGITEGVVIKMLSGVPIKNVPERVLNRFYLALMLFDLWNEVQVFQVSEKYEISRGIVQTLMTNSATFASNVINFCEELEEFWAFSHLFKGMSQRLSHCCVKELLPLMDLPAVKQNRARQLFNAGFKNLQSIAKTNADELMERIEFMPRRLANQLIAAAKMLLLEKVENLREEAEDVLDGVEFPNNQTITRIQK